MHRPIDHRPGQHRETARRHFQRVAQHDRVGARRDPFVAVRSIEPPRAGEPELDRLPRNVLHYDIPDRAVSAARADAKRAVELHLGPREPWPERIVSGCQRIDERADPIRARLQFALVNIQYPRDTSLADAQPCFRGPPTPVASCRHGTWIRQTPSPSTGTPGLRSAVLHTHQPRGRPRERRPTRAGRSAPCGCGAIHAHQVHREVGGGTLAP